ncbi:MAG: cytochrome c [candidate division NC10 bacterium]|nr:cytochrome c [candidate division NC10 bacterium]
MRFRVGRRAILLMLLAGVGVAMILLWNVRPPHGAGTPTAPGVPQGRALYDAHCAVCHGPGGKGDGPGARVVRQPMRDFSDPAAMRDLNDRFLIEITKKGSSQFGRSNAMPAWSMKLSDEEIRAVVAYIRSLAPRNPPASSGRKEKP